jgi:hypothetical protein
MGLEEMMQKQIALAISKLKTETNPKKIEKIYEALKKLGLTEEEIETRLESPEIAPEVPSAPRDKGYKKGNLNSGDQMYILACTHQIRAKKQVGIFSKGMIGKTVWCDVCSAERVVTSMPYWVR